MFIGNMPGNGSERHLPPARTSIGWVFVQGHVGERALGPALQGRGIARLDPLREGGGQFAVAEAELGGQYPRFPTLHTLLHTFFSAFLQKSLRKTDHGGHLERVQLGVKLTNGGRGRGLCATFPGLDSGFPAGMTRETAAWLSLPGIPASRPE